MIPFYHHHHLHHIDLLKAYFYGISEFPGLLSALLHEVLCRLITVKWFLLSFLRPLCLRQVPQRSTLLPRQGRQDRMNCLVRTSEIEYSVFVCSVYTGSYSSPFSLVYLNSRKPLYCPLIKIKDPLVYGLWRLNVKIYCSFILGNVL